MKHKTVFIPVFFLLLIPVVILLMLLAPGTQTVQAITQINLEPASHGWQQVNLDGFGDGKNVEIMRFSVHDGYLFASTDNEVSGGEVWRTINGVNWNQVNQNGFGIVTNKTAHVESSFQGKLYVGTANIVTAAQIWRCTVCDGSDLDDWELVADNGFGDPNNMNIERVLNLSNTLYAIMNNGTTGAEVWKSSTGDLGSWSQNNIDGFGNPQNAAAWAAAVYGEKLYVGTNNPVGIEVWRTDGNGVWQKVTSTGFGGTGNGAWDLSVADGQLYLSSASIAGSRVWRCSLCDGTDWEEISVDSFGEKAYGVVLYEYRQKIIAATTNNKTIGEDGFDVWESDDQSNWTLVNSHGFGDDENQKVGTGAMLKYGDDLYIGTQNFATGGEIWRLQPPPYEVTLSADQSYFGPVGGQVDYTLTVFNTGTMTDNIDLIASGQIWTTTLSTPMVNLAPSTSTIFTVTVFIPPDAGYLDSDSVTITATSQGDINSTDTATLTTTSILAPEYGVTLSGDDSLTGPAGEQVIYNLTINNTGNVVDTFNLLLTGNNWTTTPSSKIVVLNAASSQVVAITVTIPPDAIASESDQVTIKATSQNDSSKTDSTDLTTVSLGKFNKIFMPVVLYNSTQ